MQINLLVPAPSVLVTLSSPSLPKKRHCAYLCLTIKSVSD